MLMQELLFEPTLVRSTRSVVQWWERRRLAYNVVVGAAGLVTTAWVTVLDSIARGHLSLTPWPLIIVYGVLANVCYSLGWVAELAVERFLKRPVYGLGPALFRHGLVFSVGLTLFPAAMLTFFSVARLFFAR